MKFPLAFLTAASVAIVLASPVPAESNFMAPSGVDDISTRSDWVTDYDANVYLPQENPYQRRSAGVSNADETGLQNKRVTKKVKKDYIPAEME